MARSSTLGTLVSIFFPIVTLFIGIAIGEAGAHTACMEVIQ